MSSEIVIECPNCNRLLNSNAGDRYIIYYGDENKTEYMDNTINIGGERVGSYSTIHHFTIKGNENLFICNECFFKKYIWEHKTTGICLLIIGIIALCTIICFPIAIVLGIGGISELNKASKVETFIHNMDQAELRKIVDDSDIMQYTRFYNLPINLLKAKLQNVGEYYSYYFNPVQYSRLKTE